VSSSPNVIKVNRMQLGRRTRRFKQTCEQSKQGFGIVGIGKSGFDITVVGAYLDCRFDSRDVLSKEHEGCRLLWSYLFEIGSHWSGFAFENMELMRWGGGFPLRHSERIYDETVD